MKHLPLGATARRRRIGWGSCGTVRALIGMGGSAVSMVVVVGLLTACSSSGSHATSSSSKTANQFSRDLDLVEGGHQHGRHHAASRQRRNFGVVLRGVSPTTRRSPTTRVAVGRLPSDGEPQWHTCPPDLGARDGMASASSGRRMARCSCISSGTARPTISGTCLSKTSQQASGRESQTSIRRRSGAGGSRSRASRQMVSRSSSSYRGATYRATTTGPGICGQCRSPVGRRPSSSATPGGAATRPTVSGSPTSHRSRRATSPAQGSGSRTSTEEHLTPWSATGVFGWVRWSPDGTRIAYSNGSAIYVVDAATGSTRKVGHGDKPEWLDDNTLIFGRLIDPPRQEPCPVRDRALGLGSPLTGAPNPVLHVTFVSDGRGVYLQLTSR